MALIDYSESESDHETPISTAKPAFRKLVDAANPRTIRISANTVAPGDDIEARPAKRTRVGGTGNFNAMLPAPKKTAEPAKVSGLKTSAAPGLCRNRPEIPSGPPTPPESNDRTQASQHDIIESRNETTKTDTSTQKPMFRPLSVARKKKPLAPPPKPIPEPEKPKISLFGTPSAPIARDSSVPMARESLCKTNGYEPLLYQPQAPEEVVEPVAAVEAPRPEESLDAIASSLGLSAAARRKLLGRQGAKGQLGDVKLTNFDLEQEYSANEAMREEGVGTQVAPVRAIAPGRHSLKQLVNNAADQKEALEESFAEGRRNKKAAGNKYGW